MTSRFCGVLTLLVALLPFASASPKRTLTHEDLWLMKRVGSPNPSPDGRWVVFTVTEPAYDSKDQVSDLWIKSLADDTPARRLTSTKGGEGGAVWSPDSTRIAFTAKREGDDASQLYVLSLAGGEAERITTLSTGVAAPKWSPDGTQLLFTSNVYPGAADDEANKKAAKERKDRKYNARVYEAFPIRYWDRWLDDRSAHLFVQEATAGAKPRDLLAGTKLAALPGFGGQLGDSAESLEGEWTPDGQGIVFVATTGRNQAAYARVFTQLYHLPIAGGEPRRLTNDSDGYGRLEFTPDGKWLLCATSRESGNVYNLSRLTAFPWPFRNEPRELTPGFDRSVGGYAVPAKGDRVFFTSDHAGMVRLYSVALAGGEVREEKSPPTGCLGGLAVTGSAVLATWESAVSPPEIWRLDGEPRALTAFNAEKVAALDLPPLEHFWHTSNKGRRIHSLLVRPPGFDPAVKYPLISLIHGGPYSQWLDQWVLRWNYHLLSAPGYVLVLTNYTGSTGFGEEFSHNIQRDPLMAPGDEINEAVDEAVRKFPFVDGNRLAAGGASYGGHLANWLQATTTRYKCLISHAGLVRLESQWGTSDVIYSREQTNGGPVWEQNPVWRNQDPADLAGNHATGTGWVTPMLITVGEQDFRVPLNNSIENWSLHQRLRIPSKLIVFPDENHWVLKGENSRFFYRQVHDWWSRWLK